MLIPHFPFRCEVLKHPLLKDKPAIVTCTTGSKKQVLDCSPELKGLQGYMSLQQALSLSGQVELLTANEPYYRSVFGGLLDSLEKISPLVEGAELGNIYMGMDGLQLIYPDDEAVIKAISGVIPEVFEARIGIANNKFLACLAAADYHPGGYKVLSDDVTGFLRDLPCDVLPVSMKARKKLKSFGLNTLGQIAALPPGPLSSQFGAEGKRIFELVHGKDDAPLYPRMMTEVIEESCVLPSITVSLEAIIVSLESLLSRVFTRIDRIGLGICELKIWTRTWSAEYWERVIRFKEPATEMKAICKRIKLVFEEYPQPGPVEQAGLIVSRLGFRRGRQDSLFSEVRAKDHLAEDIQHLELRLGNPQVYRVQEVEPWSRIPERHYILAPTSK